VEAASAIRYEGRTSVKQRERLLPAGHYAKSESKSVCADRVEHRFVNRVSGSIASNQSRRISFADAA
jgi:hypothetical protein